MDYLVDGHNLIPKIGLHLDAFDDEDRLIGILQEFCRIRRARVEVYFDDAPPARQSTRKAGLVTAHYVRKASSADAAIEARLEKLGRQARGWSVVSSDRRVQAAARAAHAGVLSSESFAAEVIKARMTEAPGDQKETTLPPEEVEEWLRIFGKKRGGEK